MGENCIRYHYANQSFLRDSSIYYTICVILTYVSSFKSSTGHHRDLLLSNLNNFATLLGHKRLSDTVSSVISIKYAYQNQSVDKVQKEIILLCSPLFR